MLQIIEAGVPRGIHPDRGQRPPCRISPTVREKLSDAIDGIDNVADTSRGGAVSAQGAAIVKIRLPNTVATADPEADPAVEAHPAADFQEKRKGSNMFP